MRMAREGLTWRVAQQRGAALMMGITDDGITLGGLLTKATEGVGIAKGFKGESKTDGPGAGSVQSFQRADHRQSQASTV